MDLDAGECAHRSLHGPSVRRDRRSWSEVEVLDAEPVRRADDRTEVPWILDAIEEQTDTRGDGTSLVLLGEGGRPQEGAEAGAANSHAPQSKLSGTTSMRLGRRACGSLSSCRLMLRAVSSSARRSSQGKAPSISPVSLIPSAMKRCCDERPLASWRLRMSLISALLSIEADFLEGIGTLPAILTL